MWNFTDTLILTLTEQQSTWEHGGDRTQLPRRIKQRSRVLEPGGSVQMENLEIPGEAVQMKDLGVSEKANL